MPPPRRPLNSHCCLSVWITPPTTVLSLFPLKVQLSAQTLEKIRAKRSCYMSQTRTFTDTLLYCPQDTCLVSFSFNNTTSISELNLKTTEHISAVTRTKSNPYTGLDRPLRLQKVEAPRISIQLAHEGGKVLSPRHRPPLNLDVTDTHSWVEPRAIVWPEGLSQWKTLMPHRETNPLAAQCVKQLRHRFPPCTRKTDFKVLSVLWCFQFTLLRIYFNLGI